MDLNHCSPIGNTCCFSSGCLNQSLIFFGFQQFDCDIPVHSLLDSFLYLESAELLNMLIYVFHQIWGLWSIVSSNNFLVLLCLLIWVSNYLYIIRPLILSHRYLIGLLISFNTVLFSSLACVISINLPWSSSTPFFLLVHLLLRSM